MLKSFGITNWNPPGLRKPCQHISVEVEQRLGIVNFNAAVLTIMS
jgi:hypothetical protein